MSNIVFKRDEIILLIGAGASVESGIPDSNEMVRKVEDLIQNDDDWKCHRELYNCIKSSIFHADGIEGIFGNSVHFNIERFVNVLEELQRKERHTLYPFVGAWTPKLIEVAGVNFRNIGLFRDSIVKILRDEWVVLRNYHRADYYSALTKFQQDYGYSLRTFSLNYDLCIEKACGSESVQTGFSSAQYWDWRLFDETSDDPVPILLYKLHGSVDWYSDKNDRIAWSEAPSSIKSDEMAMIFGTSYKLQYVDPFLFLAYELRRWTLDSARLIIAIGYGFNDDHINGILEQSLRADENRKLLAIVGPGDEQFAADQKKRISKSLKIDSSQIVTRAQGAREFFEEHLTIPKLSSLFTDDEPDLIPELPISPD